MDRAQEELQFLGLFGIFAESFKLIFRWRRIFTQITLSLILPLSFLFLTHHHFSVFLRRWIKHAEYRALADLLSPVWAAYLLLKALYFTLLIILSLLSTSAVVYTVASIYAARGADTITFPKVLAVVPTVWKRLMLTFLCAFLAFVAYNALFLLAAFCYLAFIGYIEVVGSAFLWLVLAAYPVGLVYMSIIWHMATVVTVLEDSCGVRAMAKSRRLVKGKVLEALVIFFVLNSSLAAIDAGFRLHVMLNWRSHGVWRNAGLGALFLLLLLLLVLIVLVVQTVIYFVCKSYHHENIDKAALSEHLEVYLGEYAPLKAKDVQLEEYHV